MRTVADEGRTVFFSSHLLDEVERVSDRVAMIIQGKVILCDTLDAIKGSHHSLTLHYDEPWEQPPTFDDVLHCHGHGKEWTLTVDGQLDAVRAQAQKTGARIVEESTPSLEDIFIAHAGVRAPDAEGAKE